MGSDSNKGANIRNQQNICGKMYGTNSMAATGFNGSQPMVGTCFPAGMCLRRAGS
jgi:hypothetical protein